MDRRSFIASSLAVSTTVISDPVQWIMSIDGKNLLLPTFLKNNPQLMNLFAKHSAISANFSKVTDFNHNDRSGLSYSDQTQKADEIWTTPKWLSFQDFNFHAFDAFHINPNQAVAKVSHLVDQLMGEEMDVTFFHLPEAEFFFCLNEGHQVVDSMICTHYLRQELFGKENSSSQAFAFDSVPLKILNDLPELKKFKIVKDNFSNAPSVGMIIRKAKGRQAVKDYSRLNLAGNPWQPAALPQQLVPIAEKFRHNLAQLLDGKIIKIKETIHVYG